MSISKSSRDSFSHQLRRGCAIGALLALGTTLPAYGAEPGVETKTLFAWSEFVPDFLLQLFDGAASEPNSELENGAARGEFDTEIEAEPPDPFTSPEPSKTRKSLGQK